MKPLALLLLPLLATPALADPAEIVAAEATRSGGTWRFDVTLRHADTGWDHYADGWRIEAADGTVLGTRELLHPHETEQPFTRSLTGVAVPDGTVEVFVRARGTAEGWGEETLTLALD